MTFRRAADPALAASLFRAGSPEALALLRAAWPRAVGAELSRRTEIQAVEGETLRVRVPDAGWGKALYRMRGEILSRLREVAGELAPRRLGFVEAALPPPPARPSRPAEAYPAPTCPPEVAVPAEAITDPEIRARFLSAAGRYLTRPGS